MACYPMSRSLALVGDHSPVLAHRAIPLALEQARFATGSAIHWRWIATRDIRSAARDLAAFAGLWVVPASPYENMAGVLDAIRFARETGRPFLGTCGGFQHALIEFARHVAGLATADHAETNPDGDTIVVARLSCPLVEKTGTVRFAPGSRLRAIYGRDTVEEAYHCNYGLNPAHREALQHAGLRFTAWDEANDVRAAELPAAMHPFFVGTLFQPERAALRGETPPIVRALLKAIDSHENRPR